MELISECISWTQVQFDIHDVIIIMDVGMGWLIGDKRGAPTGYLHNSDTSRNCVYNLAGGWLYYSAQHGSWFPDNTLVVRCITP